MDPILVAILMMILLMVAILAGVHIGVALLSVSVLGMWLITDSLGVVGSMLGTAPFYATFEYLLAVIPLFVLMGLMANLSGASEDVYDAANTWVGNLRGGLGIATVVGNGAFAAVTGISVASAAMFSKVALPQMLRLGYDKRFSLGTIAGSSVLGMLIPPSVLLIVYGVLAEESIGRLFAAGVVPGLVLVAVYSLGIWTMCRFNPRLTGTSLKHERRSWKSRLRALRKTFGIVALIILVLGGIYGGFFTPTEAGAVGTIAALLLALIKRRVSISNLKSALTETGLMTASFFFLLIGAQIFSRMLAMSGIVSEFAGFVVALPVPPILIIAMVLVVLMVMGAFLDCISIMIVLLPIVLPTVKALGFDLIWFGIISVMAIETGLITPPFGMVPFTIKAAIGQSATLEDIFAGALPFLLMMILVIVILVCFPSLSTWLPGTM